MRQRLRLNFRLLAFFYGFISLPNVRRLKVLNFCSGVLNPSKFRKTLPGGQHDFTSGGVEFLSGKTQPASTADFAFYTGSRDFIDGWDSRLRDLKQNNRFLSYKQTPVAGSRQVIGLTAVGSAKFKSKA